ncbi:hypothetical protein V5O48_011329 [Marasmius crinis-equi]|uniref:Uncharacterized protein n=1 Tax=Marasmius crinis-equi TaxID=585013 RepID=A0ABR3F5Y4_9AGAR
MDIIFSKSLLESHPQGANDMLDLLSMQCSQDLLRITRGPDILAGLKTTTWRKSDDAVEHQRPDLEPSRVAALWVTCEEVLAGNMMIDSVLQRLETRHGPLDRKLILFIGLQATGDKIRLSSVTSSLMVHERAIVKHCETVQDGLQAVYRWSVAMNPYCLVLRESHLSNRKAECYLLYLLLQSSFSTSVPESKRIVKEYPTLDSMREAARAKQRGETLQDGIPDELWTRLAHMVGRVTR